MRVALRCITTAKFTPSRLALHRSPRPCRARLVRWPGPAYQDDKLTSMSDDHPTRREALAGLAAASLVTGALNVQAAAPPLCFMSAVEMAKLIRTKKLSAREALAEHLKQIERVNERVNAIVTLVPEVAAIAAAKADEMQARNETLGPLHGLPVAHKDLFETKNIRTTFGSLLYQFNIPKEDDIVVERMARAGAITIGKTNTP